MKFKLKITIVSVQILFNTNVAKGFFSGYDGGQSMFDIRKDEQRKTIN
jgi:hypothetical protein